MKAINGSGHILFVINVCCFWIKNLENKTVCVIAKNYFLFTNSFLLIFMKYNDFTYHISYNKRSRSYAKHEKGALFCIQNILNKSENATLLLLVKITEKCFYFNFFFVEQNV